MKLDALQPASAEGRKSVVVLQAPELALHGNASAVEVFEPLAVPWDAREQPTAKGERQRNLIGLRAPERVIIGDMRVLLDGDPGRRPELRWATTRDRLRPEKDDGFAYPTPFSIPGRGTREVIAEFQPSADLNWSAPPGSKLRLRLQAQIHPKDEWVDLVAFDWWAPPEDTQGLYIAHCNEPTAAP